MARAARRVCVAVLVRHTAYAKAAARTAWVLARVVRVLGVMTADWYGTETG